MSILNIRAEGECKYDILSLGEIMIRLDPGENVFILHAILRCGRAAVNTMSLAV